MKKSAIMILIVLFTFIAANPAIAGRGGHSNNRGYNSHYYAGHGNWGHGGHGGNYPAALLGGLIVGGIIGSTLNPPHYRGPVYVNTYPVNVTSGSNFLLKSNGDCFLITNSSNGNQILSSVPESNCR